MLAQNSFSPEPETGRFDGGLGQWLRGLGGMQFDAVGAAASGIVVPEDAKALALLDLGGDGVPDLLVAVNDGPVRVFTNTTAAGLGIALRGPAGNPTAIGARVTLRHPDGSTQVR